MIFNDGIGTTELAQTDPTLPPQEMHTTEMHTITTTTTTVLRPFFRDHLAEPVPEKNF